MDIQQVFALADNFGVLVLSLYIIQNGMTQMKDLHSQHNGFVKSVLDQQQVNNQSLSDLVKDLCHK